MTDKPQREKGGEWEVVVVGLLLLALPALYVLSSGPVAWLVAYDDFSLVT